MLNPHTRRALRSSTQQLLQVPYMSTDFGKHAFNYSSPATWNSITTSIFQEVSDLVTSTGFLSTTEYSSKSPHSPIRPWQPVSHLISTISSNYTSHHELSGQQLLQVPYMSTDFGRRTFSYSSPATWIELLKIARPYIVSSAT